MPKGKRPKRFQHTARDILGEKHTLLLEKVKHHNLRIITLQHILDGKDAQSLVDNYNKHYTEVGLNVPIAQDRKVGVRGRLNTIIAHIQKAPEIDNKTRRQIISEVKKRLVELEQVRVGKPKEGEKAVAKISAKDAKAKAEEIIEAAMIPVITPQRKQLLVLVLRELLKGSDARKLLKSFPTLNKRARFPPVKDNRSALIGALRTIANKIQDRKLADEIFRLSDNIPTK